PLWGPAELERQCTVGATAARRHGSLPRTPPLVVIVVIVAVTEIEAARCRDEFDRGSLGGAVVHRLAGDGVTAQDAVHLDLETGVLQLLHGLIAVHADHVGYVDLRRPGRDGECDRATRAQAGARVRALADHGVLGDVLALLL